MAEASFEDHGGDRLRDARRRAVRRGGRGPVGDPGLRRDGADAAERPLALAGGQRGRDLAALAGYLLAWLGIARAGGGPQLGRGQRFAAVLVGFGGFVGRGGSAIDRYVFLAAGADQRDADVRIAALDALEHVPLAVACCPSAIFLLAVGHTDPPPLDFLWPWAVAPPAGAVLAVLLVSRYRGRFRDSSGPRRYAGPRPGRGR